MKICFYVDLSMHKDWRQMLEKIEFYSTDIQVLRELGHEIVLAGAPRMLDFSADLYYAWWWVRSAIPVLLAKIRSKPVIVTGAFDYATCRRELPGQCYLDRPLWQQCLMRSVLRFADASLFVSEYERNEVVDALHVRNPIVLPHSVDTAYYRPVEPRVNERPFFFSVTWTSRENVVRKGVVPMIRAFASFAKVNPDVLLVIAGKPGNYQQELNKLVEVEGVSQRVRFVGMISREEKLRYYQNCCAYVQPTLYEGFGVAIAEALASGCRVITSRRGAVPEVAGQYATYVEPDDVAAIEKALAESIESRLTMDQQMASHHWIASRFSINCRREKLQQIITQVANRP